jgi:hypothetical protein
VPVRVLDCSRNGSSSSVMAGIDRPAGHLALGGANDTWPDVDRGPSSATSASE